MVPVPCASVGAQLIVAVLLLIVTVSLPGVAAVERDGTRCSCRRALEGLGPSPLGRQGGSGDGNGRAGDQELVSTRPERRIRNGGHQYLQGHRRVVSEIRTRGSGRLLNGPT